MATATIERAAELLERLVGFDTVSHKSNIACVAFIEDTLRASGIRTFRALNGDRDKAALIGWIGPMAPGGVVLSGHTDVVPVAGQQWTGDPFRLRREGGRLIGRGAVDMKGFLACAIAAGEAASSKRLKAPVYLAFSYDEETTCLGSLDLIARYGRDLAKPSLAIVGEPTSLQVADAHKGVATFHTRVEGRAAHSSRPALGADAVGVACDIASEINRLGRARESGRLDSRFDPPHSTYFVGVVRGGEARNVLAEECSLYWEFRGLPGESVEVAAQAVQEFVERIALPRLRRWRSDVGIVTRMEIDVPALRAAPEAGPGIGLALDLAGQRTTVAAPFASEAGHFQRAGIDTVLCGPGSIAQAHQPDEFVEADQLAACLAMIGRLTNRFSF